MKMWKAYENDGRIWIAHPDGHNTITPREADSLSAQLSIIRNSQRNAVHGIVYELYIHHDGVIENAGYYATVVRDGDKAELLRTKKYQRLAETREAANKQYGRNVEFFAVVQPDTVSFATAEREQLLYLARKLASERGLTLTQLLAEAREARNAKE